MLIFQRSGQVTIVALLLSLLGLTVGLSALSRSLSDLKQSTEVGVGTKTFAAAEAGLQYALNDFSQNLASYCPTPKTISGSDLAISGIKSLEYTICPSTQNYASLANVTPDNAFQLSFGPGTPTELRTLDVSWKNNNTAVEAIIFYNNNTYARYVFNGLTANFVNGFNTAAGATVGNCVSAATYCSDTTFSSGSCIRAIPTGVGTNQATMIRVKPLYQATDVVICGKDSSGTSLPLNSQYYRITVTAKATNDATIRIEAVKAPSALSPFFDFALYSRGSIVK